MIRRLGFAVLFVLCAMPARGAEETPLPPADGKPILQLEAGGPTAAVTALVFSDDGKTLYAAGLDKVVRVWEQEEVDKKVVWTLKRSFRVPIGPGVSGAINALALSPDGRWLAVGGRSVMRGESDFQQPGVVVDISALSSAMWRDGGTIYVFDQQNQMGGKVLRGHQGEVRKLAFAPQRAGKPPLLVSAAIERGSGKPFGSVRLWDVEKGGEALAVLDKLPARPEGPGLALWHTGDGKTDVRVAIAWPETDPDADDGVVRLWDAAAQGAAARQSWECGPWNSTAALLGVDDNEPSVALGSVSQFGNDKTGGLRVWRFSRAADTKANIERSMPFVFDRLAHRPLALAPVSSQANGRFDAVAAVLQPGKPNLANVLALTDVAANPATVTVRFPLKNADPVHVPVLAASAHGKWLAVAGFKDRAIEIYAIEDLLAQKTQPAARLHSKGVLYSKAVIVRREKEMGLWLSEDAKADPLQDGVFFNFEKRALANDAKGWTNDTPSRAGWDVDFKDGTASVTHAGTVSKMVLDPGAEPTWYALLPSTPQRKQALLAVAHTNRATSETFITLFDVATGRPLRRFSGHLQDVRWLAFSDTHPLLVSASEDQTVRVWSFADLNVDAGMIMGLGVGERDGKVVILAVDPNSAAAKAGLKVDDVIEGFVGGDGKVKPVTSHGDFYWTVRLKKPTDTIDVKIVGKPGVRVAVGQGIEERKPLLSLFVTRDGHEWIGWTPGGPFDRSSDNADALIGWHVNTGKPEHPVTFDNAREDKTKTFYKRDILKYLISEGSLERALEKIKQPPPEAELSIRVEGADRLAQRADHFQTREKDVKLSATVNADYPLDPHDQLLWQAVKPDGGKLPPQPMEHAGVDDRTWEADLSKLPWKQGDFRIEVLFRSEKYEKTKLQALTLRYQPPAPHLSAVAEKKEIKTDAEPLTLTVMEPKIAVEVTVKPEPGQTVEVRFVQPGGQAVPKPRTIAKEETFTQEFTLVEGANPLEIVAVNKDALKDFETDQTSVLRLKVQFKMTGMPIIAGLRITPPTEESFRDGDDNNVLVVSVPEITIHSGITAADPMTLAEWSVDNKAKSLLDPQSPKKLDVSQKVALQAGRTTVLRLRAATKSSKAAEELVRVVYRPRLPRFLAGAVDGGPEVFRKEATIRGLFLPSPANEAYQATVRVTNEEGKEVGNGKLTVDAEGKWTAVVPLVRGQNTVAVTVQNEWRPAVAERLAVTYKQPPVIEPLKKIEVDKALITLEATVWSPPGVEPKGVLIDDHEAQAKDVVFRKNEMTKDGLTGWLVTVRNVAVKEGEQSRVLNVSNADGWSRQPETITITMKKPPPPRPTVQLRLQKVETAQQAEYTVPIYVRSATPLLRVELWRGEERKAIYQADLSGGPKLELEEEVKIALEEGPNRLRLLAVNDGGESVPAEATVTLKSPPVSVFVDKMDLLEADSTVSKSLRPSEAHWERVRFDELTRGFVLLHGHVTWTDDKADKLNTPGLEVVVYVNGARQFPVALESRGSGKQRNQRAFHIPLLLRKEKNNTVEIVLPSLPKEESTLGAFAVDCARPVKAQRFHVLVIGVNVADGEKLKTNFLSRFGSELPSGTSGAFKSTAFESAYLHDVLSGTVEKNDVLGRLGDIAVAIRKLQKLAPLETDVVLIYFQGSEATDGRGNRYLKTSTNEVYPSRRLEETAVAYSQLAPMPGVQLLVLNVSPPTRQGDALADKDERLVDPRVGFMRYVWQVAEVRKPNPKFLTYLGGAMQTARTLDEIATQVSEQVKKDTQALGANFLAQDTIKNLPLNKPNK